MKRTTLFFDAPISSETVNDLIYLFKNNKRPIDLFISTPGGEMAAARVLINHINKNMDDINIYLTGTICSAGTFFLTDCTKPVFVTEDLLFLLFHTIDMPQETMTRKEDISSKELKKQLDIDNKVLAEKYQKLGLTDKEIKSFFKGEEVVLYRKDFHRLNIEQVNLF